jgi:hypothetical protein
MEWKTIDSAPTQTSVLIHYKNGAGRSRVIKAIFTPRWTVEYQDSEYGDGEGCYEYHEERDCYYYVEAWWEQIDNWGDFTQVMVCEGTPDLWHPLPRPSTT